MGESKIRSAPFGLRCSRVVVERPAWVVLDGGPKVLKNLKKLKPLCSLLEEFEKSRKFKECGFQKLRKRYAKALADEVWEEPPDFI